MEQWNDAVKWKMQEAYEALGWGKAGQTCSLNEYLYRRYLRNLLEESGEECESDIDSLGKKEITKLVDEIYDNMGWEKNPDDEVKNLKNKLFLIIDSLLGKGNHKLLANKDGQYVLNIENCLFFDYLFETFNSDDSKRIRKKMMQDISMEYINYIFSGLEDLANNENMELDYERLKILYNQDFYIAYREMKDAFESLKSIMAYYDNLSSQSEKNVQFFKEATKMIKECEEGLFEKGERMTDRFTDDPDDEVIMKIINKEK